MRMTQLHNGLTRYLQSNAKTWKYVAIGFGGVLVAAYLIAALRIPFADRDTEFYVMIGRPLIQHGILPYDGLFDHKPIGLYTIYGLWSEIAPQTGMFALLALTSILITAWLARAWNLPFGVTALAYLATGGTFRILAGNSELAFLPVQFAALILIARRHALPAFLAGVLVGLAAEINYLCLPGSALPLLFGLSLSGAPGIAGTRWARLLACALGGLLGFGLPLLAFTGHEQTLLNYFTMQSRYLHNYGGTGETRYSAFLMLGLWSACVLPLFSLRQRDQAKAWLLRFWALGGLTAAALSGEPFSHYFLMVLLPCLLLGIMAWQNSPAGRSLLPFVPLAALSIYGLIADTKQDFQLPPQLAALDAPSLHELIGDQPVLGVEMSPPAAYLAGIKPMGHFWFAGHMERIYGQDAEQVYLNELNQRPVFVMAGPHSCEPPSPQFPAFCAALASSYQLVKQTPGKFGYRLYQRP